MCGGTRRSGCIRIVSIIIFYLTFIHREPCSLCARPCSAHTFLLNALNVNVLLITPPPFHPTAPHCLAQCAARAACAAHACRYVCYVYTCRTQAHASTLLCLHKCQTGNLYKHTTNAHRRRMQAHAPPHAPLSSEWLHLAAQRAIECRVYVHMHTHSTHTAHTHISRTYRSAVARLWARWAQINKAVQWRNTPAGSTHYWYTQPERACVCT